MEMSFGSVQIISRLDSQSKFQMFTLIELAHFDYDLTFRMYYLNRTMQFRFWTFLSHVIKTALS